ncbi:hypothetical protein JTB14_005238 [Gonioctena quinquepunctata]|nr:hypothetical protein JTB14_005238 [Gonioctena quinquepunctata]
MLNSKRAFLITMFMACYFLLETTSYTCTSAGRFADITSNRSFYICAYYGGSFLVSNYTCPIAKVFNETLGICI